MSYEVDLSPELVDEIRKSVPVRLPETKAELPIEEVEIRRLSREKELKRQQVHSQRWVKNEEIKIKNEAMNFASLTAGRHKMLTKEFQVLFRDDVCPHGCNAPVKYVLEGWNKNASIRGYTDTTIAYDPNEFDSQLNFTRVHRCSGDVNQMVSFLTSRIEKLESTIKQIKNETETNKKMQEAAYAAQF